MASDISSGLLKHYVREGSLAQTEQDRPLLRFLRAGQKTIPGGNLYVSKAVRGVSMNDTAGFLTGYDEDDQLLFAQSANIQRVESRWYEVHAGLIITWTELKKDGISIVGNTGKRSEHSGIAIDRLTSLLAERLEDFGDSWSRALNRMFWSDGSIDAKQMPGVRYWMTDVTNTGTKGGISRATYSWWRHHSFTGVGSSEANQTLTKTMRSKQRLIRKRGGKPNKFLAGSDFITALEEEVAGKGDYTTSGFTKGTDVSMGDISLRGVGNFEYDPELDDMGMANYCFEFDSRRFMLHPLQDEDNKVIDPIRPYNYAVFLQSMTFTGVLMCNQLNAQAVWSSAAAQP